MPKALLVSVGGSPAPLIHSLNTQRPDYVIYFSSRDTRRVVRESIEPALSFRPLDHEMIVTPDEQDLLSSVAALRAGLPAILQLWGLDYADLVGDYTGGTKTMSAALVLALTGKGCRYSYVGGLERDKAGLGVVIDGKEQILRLKNPWDVLALDDLKELRVLFGRCRFRAVRDLAERTARRAEVNRTFFQALESLAEGYYQWDNFQYRAAHPALAKGLGLLRPFADGHRQPGLTAFLEEATASLTRLELLKIDAAQFKSNPSRKDLEQVRGGDGSAIIVDVLANAVRRAEIEYKFDDAVARLYSAIEKMAKVRLKLAHGLDNSHIDLDKLTDPVLREELAAGRLESAEKKIQLPLHRSFELLARLSDPLGQAYLQAEPELRQVLSIRNNSLLAHGFDPVTEGTYRNLLGIALRFAEVDAEKLPRFPSLDKVEDFF